jgi:phosphohistidine phosphatase
MKKLHLIRHAKSSWDNPSDSDFDRPLNERGKRDAPLMSKRFAASHRPQAIVSSPALRAISTAKIFARALNMKEVHQEKEIYEAPLSALVPVLCEFQNAWQEVAVFGHNPGLSLLTHYLTGEYPEMPTCAIVSIDLFIDDWAAVTANAGRCSGFDYPKKHTA